MVPRTAANRVLFFLYLFAHLTVLPACDAQREYEAAVLLSDIAASGGPSHLKSMTPVPRRSRLLISDSGPTRSADLYLLNEAPLAGLLLLPGAAEGGKDDPRLVAFAMSLARARFAVLVPDL